MNKYINPATISLVLMFIAGGVHAISTDMPAPVLTVIMGVLGVAAFYFHVDITNQLQGQIDALKGKA